MYMDSVRGFRRPVREWRARDDRHNFQASDAHDAFLASDCCGLMSSGDLSKAPIVLLDLVRMTRAERRDLEKLDAGVSSLARGRALHL